MQQGTPIEICLNSILLHEIASYQISIEQLEQK